MFYEPKNFDHLLGTEGFSETSLKNHFTLYQGYVTNTNKLIETLGNLEEEGRGAMPEYAELKRRFGWEFNGMRLHEFYFGSMTKYGHPLERSSRLVNKLKEDFGGYENWEKSFKAAAMMRGIGWAILYFDPVANRLFNVWVNEHDFGHLAGGVPLLPLDIFEHAYMPDYGLKRADYIEAFLKVIDWKAVDKRFTSYPESSDSKPGPTDHYSTPSQLAV